MALIPGFESGPSQPNPLTLVNSVVGGRSEHKANEGKVAPHVFSSDLPRPGRTMQHGACRSVGSDLPVVGRSVHMLGAKGNPIPTVL